MLCSIGYKIGAEFWDIILNQSIALIPASQARPD